MWTLQGDESIQVNGCIGVQIGSFNSKICHAASKTYILELGLPIRIVAYHVCLTRMRDTWNPVTRWLLVAFGKGMRLRLRIHLEGTYVRIYRSESKFFLVVFIFSPNCTGYEKVFHPNPITSICFVSLILTGTFHSHCIFIFIPRTKMALYNACIHFIRLVLILRIYQSTMMGGIVQRGSCNWYTNSWKTNQKGRHQSTWIRLDKGPRRTLTTTKRRRRRGRRRRSVY